MQEKQGENRSDDNWSQNIFHRENGPANGEELQQDEAFREFFTNTVIEVPEDMRHVTARILLEEQAEPPKKKGFFSWLRRKDDEDEEEAFYEEETSDVQAEEEESFETDFEDGDDDASEEDVLEESSLMEFDQQSQPEPQKKTEQTPKAEPQQEEKPAEKQHRITADELMRKTAQQKVSVDELLNQINYLENGEIDPEPKKLAAEPQEPKVLMPEMQPCTEMQPETEPVLPHEEEPQPVQMESAQAEKKRLDEMMAGIYTHASEADVSPSMMLVEEDGEVGEEKIDRDTVTLEIPLNLSQELQMPAEGTVQTGEILLSAEADASDEDALVSQWDFAEKEAEPTGEISFTKLEEPETAAEDFIPDADNDTQGTVALEREGADDTSDAEEASEEKHGGWHGILNMLGLDSIREEVEADTDEEELEEESEEDSEAQETEKNGFKFVFRKWFGGDKSESEQEEQRLAEQESAELPIEEYTNPEDAPQLQERLQKRCSQLTLATAISGILAVALLVLDILGQFGTDMLTGVDPIASPATWLCVNLLLLLGCALLNTHGLIEGLKSLLPGNKPTADGLPALAVCAAAMQLVLALVFLKDFDLTKQAMFAGMAAILVFASLLGKRMKAAVDRDGFAGMTSGVNHSTAYRLEDRAMTQLLCNGMDEDDPVVMLSRPDAMMKGFVAQSSAPHYCDQRSVLLVRLLGAAALVGAFITMVRGGNAVTAMSVLAGVLCLGAPVGMLLLCGVSTLLMQKSASQVGAVIPGWPSIEKLGEVDVLQVDASELFPPICARLDGIKTFQKERIDSAILYATSVLIAGCNTLEGLFRGMIENHTDMLYPVKDLEVRTGRGYVAWCDHCRVVLGTREMMQDEGIALPALDYEKRYTKEGSSHVLYLAVSGKLYAMFLFGYNGTKQVAHTLNILRKENIRLLVTAQDPTLTERRIEEIYRLRPGLVKVLNADETERLRPAVGYLPYEDGCMVHLGGFVSMVGGLRAAAGAEDAQRSGSTIQTVAAAVAIVIGLLLSVTGGMASISLVAVLLYQLAWATLGIVLAATKKY